MWTGEACAHTSSLGPRNISEKPPVQDSSSFPGAQRCQCLAPWVTAGLACGSRAVAVPSRVWGRGESGLTCPDISVRLSPERQAAGRTLGAGMLSGRRAPGSALLGTGGRGPRQAAETGPPLSTVGAWRGSKLQEELTRARLRGPRSCAVFTHRGQPTCVQPQDHAQG